MSLKHVDAQQLYGVPRPKHEAHTTITASTSHSFAASLGSLIAAAPKNTTTSGTKNRPSRETRSKDDIFAVHNKGTRKRAAADALDNEHVSATSTKHKSAAGAVDHDVLHRSKRKMEEKARLYSAMKRGDYLPASKGFQTEDAGPLVDFDRKWAESQAEGAGEEELTDTSDDNSEQQEDEQVEYLDEFGRTRTGSRAEAEREKQRQRIAVNAERELAEMSARPSMPEGLILGDTVQSAAFQPDTAVERAMAELAAKRDRSATPPEETHYDGTREVRSKGVGFYQFSRDKATRQQEFADLDKARLETEQHERERDDRRQKKAAEMEERRRKIREKRSLRQADGFLQRLDQELDSNSKDPDDE